MKAEAKTRHGCTLFLGFGGIPLESGPNPFSAREPRE